MLIRISLPFVRGRTVLQFQADLGKSTQQPTSDTQHRPGAAALSDVCTDVRVGPEHPMWAEEVEKQEQLCRRVQTTYCGVNIVVGTHKITKCTCSCFYSRLWGWG